MESLQNKIALITGGSRGLGKATALALAKEGVDIIITGRNLESLKSTQKEIENLGVKAFFYCFDVTQKEQIHAVVREIKKDFGKVDILINNAGIAAFGGILEMEETQWEKIIQTNLMAPYYLCKAIAPLMIAQKSGDIINISSTAGLKGNAVTSAYSASKAGLIALSESLMFELRKHNVRVTTLTPSTISTDMTMKDLKITDGNPEKVLQPEDFAQLIVSLLKFNRRAMLANASLWSVNP